MVNFIIAYFIKKYNSDLQNFLDPIFMFNGTGSSCNIPPGITYADTFNCSFGYYSQNLLTAVFDLQSTYDDNYTLYITTEGKIILLNKLLIPHP
jgi:hypothetical protein